MFHDSSQAFELQAHLNFSTLWFRSTENEITQWRISEAHRCSFADFIQMVTIPISIPCRQQPINISSEVNFGILACKIEVVGNIEELVVMIVVCN